MPKITIVDKNDQVQSVDNGLIEYNKAMSTNFYNKVAKKFGGYHTDHKEVTEYPNGNPEQVFKEKLLERSGKDKTALDVGCADGRFTLAIASNFQRIVAIDMSSGMLNSARNLQKEKGISNVDFEEQDAHRTSFQDSSFDLVYSRRGPSDYQETHRLLKPGGGFVEIEIGEKDCQQIKEVFGRGQGFEKWDSSIMEEGRQKLLEAGLQVEFAKEYFYDEFYATYGDLELFLQGVPIFEDFDPQKDKPLLEDYVSKFKSEKGIRLPRHRVVLVAEKK